MPMFFVIAFSGSFSRLSDLPSFPTDNVLNWFVPFAILQGAAFAGFGTGFSTVRDIETGFYDRLLLAPGSRAGLFVGPIIASSCAPRSPWSSCCSSASPSAPTSPAALSACSCSGSPASAWP